MALFRSTIFNCSGILGALMVINSFPSERALSLRERASGTYYASAYFLAKTTAEGICSVFQPLIFSLIVYFIVGFQPVASKFIIFALFMTFCQLAAISMALAVSAICRTTDLSVTLLPVLLEIGRLFGKLDGMKLLSHSLRILVLQYSESSIERKKNCIFLMFSYINNMPMICNIYCILKVDFSCHRQIFRYTFHGLTHCHM